MEEPEKYENENKTDVEREPLKQHLKGRGALSNPDNRFADKTVRAFHDGWDRVEAPKSIATEVIVEQVKTIITTNRSPDIPFDYSINPYRGCEHGCIYCYARPTHAYWDMSPGLDFETRIVTKPGAAELLRKTLSKKNYVVKPICIGANTDPYQPLESTLKITRSLLEVLQEFRHPFSMITKSQMVVRDLDILAEMAAANLCSMAVTVTTLDNSLKRKLEPRAASGDARIEAIRKLSAAGVNVTMLVAPVIPFVNDHEMEKILEAGKHAGAVAARYIFLRLPREVSPMFREWLAEHFPGRAARVMSIVQQSRGGKDYQSGFGKRMTGEGVFAKTLSGRFSVAAKRLGFDDEHRFELDSQQFTSPATAQMGLF